MIRNKYGAANHVLYKFYFGSLLGFTKCDFDTSNADFAIFINDECLKFNFKVHLVDWTKCSLYLMRDYGIYV